jgi:hypothetical protein
MAADEIINSSLVLVHPVRYLPRTRLLHLAEHHANTSLCGRSRVGRIAKDSELGSVLGGVTLTLCTRCGARQNLAAQGRPIGRAPARPPT